MMILAKHCKGRYMYTVMNKLVQTTTRLNRYCMIFHAVSVSASFAALEYV